MREFVTDAFVLKKRPRGEMDISVDLYTEHMGRIEGRVVSGQKMTSKFSPHLNVPNFVIVRIVEKNFFTVTDAISHNIFLGTKKDGRALRNVLNSFFLLSFMSPPQVCDEKMWEYLVFSMRDLSTNPRRILQLLGHDPSSAECASCGAHDVAYIEKGEVSFLCVECGFKRGSDAVLLLI